jgi:hypothetical protein
LKKGQTKQSAASLQSLQLQFEVIVLAVLLASFSEQQCPEEISNVLCQAKPLLNSSLLWMYPNKCQTAETNAATF